MAKNKRKSARSEVERNRRYREERMINEGKLLGVQMEMVSLRRVSGGLWKELATALIAVIAEADDRTCRVQGAEENAMIWIAGIFRDIREVRNLRELTALMTKNGLMTRWKTAKESN